MKEAELQEKLNVTPEHSKLLTIQIAKVTTISKCYVDYAAFRTSLIFRPTLMLGSFIG
jgi:hypothetical protein